MTLKTTNVSSAAVVALFTLLACTRPVNAQINGSAMPWVKPQFFTNGGLPAVGYKLCTYQAGTNTPLLTYTTSSLSVPNTDPVVLDSAGRANIFLSPVAYKIVLLNSTSTTADCLTNGMSVIWSEDNIINEADLLKVALASASGASLIGYNLGVTGSVTTTVQTELRQVYNLKADFGAAGDGVTNDSAALTAAMQAAGANNAELHIPAGTYAICGVTPWVVGTGNASNVNLYGDGPRTSVFVSHSSCQAYNSAASITIYTSGNVSLRNFGYDSLVTNNVAFGGLTGIGVHGTDWTGTQTDAPASVTLDSLYIAHGPFVGFGCQPCQNFKQTNTMYYQNYWYGMSIASGGSTASPPTPLKNFTVADNTYIESPINGFSFWLTGIAESNESFDRSTLDLITLPNAGYTGTNLTFSGTPDYGCTAVTCGTGSIACDICIEGSQNINIGNVYATGLGLNSPYVTGLLGGIYCFGSNLGNGGPVLEMPCSDVHLHDIVINGITDGSVPIAISGASNGSAPVLGSNNTIMNTVSIGDYSCASISASTASVFQGNDCENSVTNGSAFGELVKSSIRNNRWHEIGQLASSEFYGILINGFGTQESQDIDIYNNEIDNDEMNPLLMGYWDQTAVAGYPSQVRHWDNHCRNCGAAWTPTPAIPHTVIGAPVFVGSGPGDCTFAGTFTGTNDAFLWIATATGTFEWNVNGGAFTTGVVITGSAQSLADGVTVTCPTLTGYTVKDEYLVGATTGGSWLANDQIENPSPNTNTNLTLGWQNRIAGSPGTWMTLNNPTDNNGHVNNFVTPAFTVTSCGTSPANGGGSDFAGIIDVGSGTVTSCTLNFGNPFTSTAYCIGSSDNTGISYYTGAGSGPTAWVFRSEQSVNMANTHITFICGGN